MKMCPVQANVFVHKGPKQEMAHTHKFAGTDDGCQKGRPFVRMEIDEDITAFFMQASADTPKSADGIVGPLFVDFYERSISGE